MKSIDKQPLLRLSVPDPLAALAQTGTMGRVYAVVDVNEQPAAQQSGEDRESLAKEVLRLKSVSCRQRRL